MEILQQITDMISKGQECVVVTVVETTGSAPGKVGFRMIITSDTIAGTVGGGALEKHAIEKAQDILSARGNARLLHINVSDIGMTCGGEVVLFIEPFYAKKKLWIFGAGHIAQALSPLAKTLGFQVTVVDNRAEFATKQRFPELIQVRHEDYDKAVTHVPSDAYVVIVTHGHQYDEEVICGLAQVNPALPYIGMIGSKNKVRLILDKVKAGGLKDFKTIYSPLGLDIGGDRPVDIAVSIAAEMLGVIHHKEGLPHCRNKLQLHAVTQERNG